MSDSVTDVSRPEPLRVWGFLLVVFGAAAAGIGSLLPWASTGLREDVQGALTSEIHGIDVVDGKVTLGLAVAGLILVLVTRLAASRRVRLVAAGLLVAIGLVIVGIAGAAALTAESRFESVAIDDIAGQLAPGLGISEAEARELVEQTAASEKIFADVEPWVWVTVAGGATLAVGGILTLALVSRRKDSETDDTPAPAEDESDAPAPAEDESDAAPESD